MIEYIVQTHPRAKNLKIKITADGKVVVVKPKHGWFFKSVDQFVEEHQDWIQKNLDKMKQQRQLLAHKPENELLIFGKKYTKRVDYDLQAKAKIGVHLSGETVFINPVSNTKTSVDTTLQNFLKNTAEKYIVPRTHQLGKKMSISFGNITLRSQKTRWGSCSSEGNLNFNWRLVHSPPPVIDYVIIHELAHRKEMNHSARFWEVVRKYDPEYLKHQGWLKRQGMNLS
jgi:predicted metal-dependent hydrolase